MIVVFLGGRVGVRRVYGGVGGCEDDCFWGSWGSCQEDYWEGGEDTFFATQMGTLL